MASKKYSLTVLLVLSTPMTYAQVVLDGTLGKAGELTGPNFAVSADLGQQHGGNLFHSFQTFNVQSGETATFSGPSTVTNVISRVTGGQGSYVNGTLQVTIPNANFYLLNPAGVMFESDAKLDMSGSFHVSTANYLRLGENGRFDASEPTRSVLTVAPPEAFGFLTNSPGKIESKGSLLEVSKEQTLSWVGGDLTIRKGHLAVGKLERMVDGRWDWSQRGGGSINLISVAAVGEVPVIPEELSKEESYLTKEPNKFGHISIIDDTVGGQANLDRTVGNVDASGARGGKIYIQGGQITLDNGYVFADTWGNKPGQGIWVKAQEELAMRNGARITTQTPLDAVDKNIGSAGQIHVQAKHLNLSDGSQISTTTKTAGVAGDVTVIAQESIDIRGHWQVATLGGNPVNSGIFSRSGHTGKGGKITVSAPLITLSDGGMISTEALSQGDGGQIVLNTSQLTVQRGGIISAESMLSKRKEAPSDKEEKSQAFYQVCDSDWCGKAGNISIHTDFLTLQQEGSIKTAAYLSGGGNICLQVNNWLYVSSDSEISALARGIQTGDDGGNLTIEQPTFVILGERSRLNTSAYGGRGGNITVVADLYIKSADEVMIDASSKMNLPGEISIDATQEDFLATLITLPKRYSTPTKFVSLSCARNRKNQNTFKVVLQEMLYPAPTDLRFFSPVE